MPEPAVWMCFGNSYSKKLQPSDKALSSEVANLKPLRPADIRKIDSTANVFFCFFFFEGGRIFQNNSKYLSRGNSFIVNEVCMRVIYYLS